MNTNITIKEKILLCVVAVAALCAIFYMFLLKPQLEAIASAETNLSDKKNEVSQYETFDQIIENTNREVDDYKEKVSKSMQDWHDNLVQHEIMVDLQNKIRKSNLYDTNISFTNVQEMNIISANDITNDEEIPTIAESLAMAYLCLTQKENGETPAAENTENASAPASSSENAPNDIILNPQTGNPPEIPDVPAELTQSFETFKQSLAGMSDKEISNEVKKIMAQSNTNIEKLDISISFQDSTYESVLTFLNMINAENPKVYVTSISYSDSTDSYISKLNTAFEEEQEEKREQAEKRAQEEAARMRESGFFDNVYPSAATTRAQIVPTAKFVYKGGSRRYTGSLTISYFSLVKMQFDGIDSMIENQDAPAEDSRSAQL